MKAEHTDKKYEDELKKLREDILYMGGLVEDQILKAVKALIDRDSDLAEIIIERDHEVNRLDVDIDDVCIRLLALHQPAGRDLRFITTGLKITTDLERMGDIAVNFCERALETINRAMKISFLSKYLERIADHATNIAEMVIFMVKGKSIRHMKELPSSV